MPAWYEKTYYENVTIPGEARLAAATDLGVHRGYAFRSGKCTIETEKHNAVDNTALLYPPCGQPMPKSTKRKGTDMDIKEDGHMIPAPFEPVLREMRTTAVDEPGLLAGSSATDNLPQLAGGVSPPVTNPNYICWFLKNRVDLDRVLYENEGVRGIHGM